MPIYEYKCTSCGDRTEVIQGINDKPLKKCAKCAGALEKLISRSSFHLKGSGWYVTDYGRKGQSGGDAGDSSSKGKSAASGDSSAGSDSASKGDSSSSGTESSGSPSSGSQRSSAKSSKQGSKKSGSSSKE